MIKPSLVLYAWHLLGAICLQKRITDLLIQVMWKIYTQTNGLWWSNWSSHWVIDWSSYSHQPLVRLITYISFGLLSLVFARNPIVAGLWKYRQNWSRQETIRKWVIQVIRVIVRTLLLPWIQWAMIQCSLVVSDFRSETKGSRFDSIYLFLIYLSLTTLGS